MRHAEPEISLEIRLMDLITRVLLGVVLGGACVVGGVWFLDQPKFNITTMTVLNEAELQRVDVLELKQAAMNGLNGNFFTLRLDEVKRLLETKPWVKEAIVQRVWPYELSASIREYEPVAFFGESQGAVQLLDKDGELFKVNAAQVSGLKLPILYGSAEKGVTFLMWRVYLPIGSELRALNMSIEVLKLSDHGIWSMHLNNGTEVVMGRGNADELVARVRDFIRTVPTALRPYGDRALIRADLRYSSGYAMEIAGVQTNASGADVRVH
ncbi:MAG: cell division protein FtsQ/DivIB [Saezia sp.]